METARDRSERHNRPKIKSVFVRTLRGRAQLVPLWATEFDLHGLELVGERERHGVSPENNGSEDQFFANLV